jgi:alkanesulfonate monooxygenase SsuD/methylene tetrahydromethanopterin reductase-like flavin-dependent oxidoreductase (luciferase family)
MTADLKLGLMLGYWVGQGPGDQLPLVKAAEDAGFDSVWTAESYGSDVFTPLAWVGAHTSRIKLGTGLCQISARTPVATAMTALTLDRLSGGRMILGLGKPLKPITHPLRADIPIILGAEGPKNVALAAEIADGWFPIFYSPRHEHLYGESLDAGFARRSSSLRPAAEFEVLPTVTVLVNDDVEAAADMLRPMMALYVGGMGAKEMNFHFDVFCRLGYEAEAHEIQDLYLEGRKDEAAAAVPTKMIEEIHLIGPVEKIRDELEIWKSSRVTTMLLGSRDPQLLRTMAELVL